MSIFKKFPGFFLIFQNLQIFSITIQIKNIYLTNKKKNNSILWKSAVPLTLSGELFSVLEPDESPLLPKKQVVLFLIHGKLYYIKLKSHSCQFPAFFLN